jgi:hypothetical protein
MAPPLSRVVVRERTPSGSAPARAASSARACGLGLRAIGIALLSLLAPQPLSAQSNNVRITQLSDVAFGALANLGVDAVRTQSICVFAHTANEGYRVTATGSAPNGAFALSSGASLLDYEVQWSPSPGQSTGSQLSPNTTLTGLTSTATQQTCNNGPATSASLILVLRSAALSSARAGSYSGTLTLIIGPE